MKTISGAAAPRRLLASLFVCALAVGAARAHQLQVEPVAVHLRPQAAYVNAEFSGNVQDITQAVNISEAEERGDGFAPAAEERLEAYVNERFTLAVNGKPLSGTLQSVRHQSDLDPTRSRFHLVMRYERDAGAANNGETFTIASRLFDYLPNAITTVSVGGLQKNLRPGESVEIDPRAFATNLARNVRDFLVLGAEHIVTGPDHLLFVLALLLVSPSLGSLVRTLTGFTIAHSLTLVLSTLSVLTLPARPVDIFVALSIVFVGLENIFARSTAHRFWVASAFGLVRGFAFASNLRDAGLPEGSALFWSLLSFNLGVEAAQVILCLVAFPLLLLWKRSAERREKFGGMSWASTVRTVSLGVVVAGGYWLLERLVG